MNILGYEALYEMKEFLRRRLVLENQKAETSKHMYEVIMKSPEDIIRQLYEKIVRGRPLPKKKGYIPSDEELRKSIWEYYENWPEDMKNHVEFIIDRCPRPPTGSSQPTS